MAQIIRVSGKIEEVTPENGKNFQLAELYYLLDCRIVETFTLNEGKLMIADEESKCMDDREVNLKATELFRQGRMNHEQLRAYFKSLEQSGATIIDAREDTLDCIAGDVLVCETFEFI